MTRSPSFTVKLIVFVVNLCPLLLFESLINSGSPILTFPLNCKYWRIARYVLSVRQTKASLSSLPFPYTFKTRWPDMRVILVLQLLLARLCVCQSVEANLLLQSPGLIYSESKLIAFEIVPGSIHVS